MTPLPPALRRTHSDCMLPMEAAGPVQSRSRSVARILLAGWPEKATRDSQNITNDTEPQRYCISASFPDLLRRCGSSNWSGSNSSGGEIHYNEKMAASREYSPRTDDSGDEGSDEASFSDCDGMSISDPHEAPESANKSADKMMQDEKGSTEPELVTMIPPIPQKKRKAAPRFLPYTKTTPRGYKVLQKAVNTRDRWSPGDAFTRKEASPMGVCIGSKRKLSDLTAAVGFLDLTPQSDARDLGWAPCGGKEPKRQRLAPGFAAARDLDLDESLKRGRPPRRAADKPCSPAKLPSVRAPRKTLQRDRTPDTWIDTSGSTPAVTIHRSHPLSLRPALP